MTKHTAWINTTGGREQPQAYCNACSEAQRALAPVGGNYMIVPWPCEFAKEEAFAALNRVVAHHEYGLNWDSSEAVCFTCEENFPRNKICSGLKVIEDGGLSI